ncbi:hypothetical protein [Streptomyces sp. H39-S7]|uniref:hypothetical protein n=1 Tax=Streptomyces sp. H39-S7 TaxID=3004357 RepID=UPI0022AFAFFE|nr:hypothetical protein [Streptomyces sp. H39-S7]MCZ4123900.1 hypothetical protein [Streptomyces sp. H39-S7]
MPVRSEPQTQPVGPAWVIAWIHIVAPDYYTEQVSAHVWCTCGFERRARGRRSVLLVVQQHIAHRTQCPLRNAAEGRQAA